MMIPIQSRIRDMSDMKAATVAPVASTDPAQVCFSWSGSSFSSSPISNPSAPPPTPSDDLLDINPRKSSFSSEQGFGVAYAFPSWPNRPSLSSTDSTDSTVNASQYITDEELLEWMPEFSPNHATVENTLSKDAAFASSMTMEQQLERLRVAAEEESRARFLAKLEAHARATQALRLAMVNERDSSKRKKRRAMSGKRRAHSSSAKMMTTHCT